MWKYPKMYVKVSKNGPSHALAKNDGRIHISFLTHFPELFSRINFENFFVSRNVKFHIFNKKSVADFEIFAQKIEKKWNYHSLLFFIKILLAKMSISATKVLLKFFLDLRQSRMSRLTPVLNECGYLTKNRYYWKSINFSNRITLRLALSLF